MSAETKNKCRGICSGVIENRLRKETNIYFLNERKEINMPYEDYNYPDEDLIN
jgi:hypothetical protein